MAYKIISHGHNADGVNMKLYSNIPVNIIEHVVISYKTHQCTLDFDLGYLNILVKNKDTT